VRRRKKKIRIRNVIKSRGRMKGRISLRFVEGGGT